MFILSLATKHKNLNLILVRSVLLTESSNFLFFFEGGGGLSFILRDFLSKKIIVADQEQECLTYQTSLNLS